MPFLNGLLFLLLAVADRLRDIRRSWLRPSVAIPRNQLLEHGEVVDYMDAAATVKLGRLEEPEVVASKVAEGHGVAEEVLLECALVLCLALLFEMLLNEPAPVVVEVLEYKRLVGRVLSLGLLQVSSGLNNRQHACQVLLQLLVVLDHLALVVLQRVERVEEWYHRFRKHLSLVDIDLYEEGEGYVIEDVFSEVVEGVSGHVLEEFRLLGEMAMALKVVDELLATGVGAGRYKLAKLVELEAVGDGLPPEVHVVVAEGCRLLPLVPPSEQCVADQPAVIPREDNKDEVLLIHGRRWRLRLLETRLRSLPQKVLVACYLWRRLLLPI